MPDVRKKPPFYLIDTSHQFYRPLGVRLAIVGMALAWAIMEIIGQDMFWVVIAGAVAAYTANVLLLTYQPPADTPPVPPEDESENVDEAIEDDTPQKPL